MKKPEKRDAEFTPISDIAAMVMKLKKEQKEPAPPVTRKLTTEIVRVSGKNEKLWRVRESHARGLKPEVGKMMPHFQRCGFPLRPPSKGTLKHERYDGDVKVTLRAHDEKIGLPFGADMLTLLWVFTAAMFGDSRSIRFKYASAILHDMGLTTVGSNYLAIARSFERVFSCSYQWEWSEIVPGKGKRIHRSQAVLFDHLDLWFHEDESKASLFEGEGFENEIVLSEYAWNWLQEARWLITDRAYALRGKPGAIQLYMVITQRGPRLRKAGDMVEIPISGPDGLDKQIGGAIYEGKKGQDRWRQLLRKWIGEVKIVWPDCPVELVNLTGCTRRGKPKKGWYLQIGWFPQPSRRMPTPTT